MPTCESKCLNYRKNTRKLDTSIYEPIEADFVEQWHIGNYPQGEQMELYKKVQWMDWDWQLASQLSEKKTKSQN